jgi:hypothetical protein
LTASIVIIHNFLIEVNDELNTSLEREVDSTEPVGNEEDNDNEDEDMSTRAILLRHIQYINED